MCVDGVVSRLLPNGGEKKFSNAAVANWTSQKLMSGMPGPVFAMEVQQNLGQDVSPLKPIELALGARLVPAGSAKQPRPSESAQRLLLMHESIRDCIFWEPTLKKAVNVMLQHSLSYTKKVSKLNRKEFDLYLKYLAQGDKGPLQLLVQGAVSRQGMMG